MKKTPYELLFIYLNRYIKKQGYARGQITLDDIEKWSILKRRQLIHFEKMEKSLFVGDPPLLSLLKAGKKKKIKFNFRIVKKIKRRKKR